MKMKKYTKKLIISILIVISILFLVQDVNTLAVTPGRVTLDFKPNSHQNIEFTVINDEHQDFKAVINVEGDLSEFIKLDKDSIKFKADEESKTLSYEVELPHELEKPGLHTANIIISKELSEKEKEDIFIGTSVAVVTQLYVRVPYPGKYAEVDLTVSEANVNEEVRFFVRVSNFGTEDINKVSGVIEILGPTNELIKTVETNEISIKSKQREELTAGWLAEGVNPGKYYAVAKVRYDGKSARAETVFGVGGLLLDLLDISIKNFRLGGVAKFDILVQNLANEKLENIYAEMIVKDNNAEVARFKSTTENIEPLEKKELIAYWDTESVKEGTYDATLILHHGDKTIEKQIKVFVTLDSIETSLFGGRAVAVGKGLRKETMIFLLVTVLILINIGWFIYFKKRKRSVKE